VARRPPAQPEAEAVRNRGRHHPRVLPPPRRRRPPHADHHTTLAPAAFPPAGQAFSAAFRATRDRDSVLGRYSIDANGETTLSTYGVLKVSRKRLVYDRKIDSAR
jgi:hypothetical protein